MGKVVDIAEARKRREEAEYRAALARIIERAKKSDW